MTHKEIHDSIRGARACSEAGGQHDALELLADAVEGIALALHANGNAMAGRSDGPDSLPFSLKATTKKIGGTTGADPGIASGSGDGYARAIVEDVDRAFQGMIFMREQSACAPRLSRSNTPSAEKINALTRRGLTADDMAAVLLVFCADKGGE
jgi:hypothetical protein